MQAVVDGEGAGLIPACAGKTTGTQPPEGPRGAHPRVCGENVQEVSLVAIPAGSSPRVRGKPHPRRRVDLPRRLIPACAGKTAR